MKCKSDKNRGKRNACFFLGILSLVTVVLCLSVSCNADRRKAQKYEYGVFLNADRTAVPK
jgi:cysteinyl-tRNA synthetase